MIANMKRGAVVVDVAIDQGGCFETSHATTHTEPIYFVDGVLHYCVSNMPAAVPHTSTFALTNATFPYLLELANKGLERAVRTARRIARGRQHLQRLRDACRRGGIAGTLVEGTGDEPSDTAPRSSKSFTTISAKSARRVFPGCGCSTARAGQSASVFIRKHLRHTLVIHRSLPSATACSRSGARVSLAGMPWHGWRGFLRLPGASARSAPCRRFAGSAG